MEGCACTGHAGTFSPPPRVSHPDMHRGTCVTHVPWCLLGLLTSGILWSRCYKLYCESWNVYRKYPPEHSQKFALSSTIKELDWYAWIGYMFVSWLCRTKAMAIRRFWLECLCCVYLYGADNNCIAEDCSSPGVEVTKPISSVPLFYQIFSIVKTYVSYSISRSYLVGVTAAQLREHL